MSLMALLSMYVYHKKWIKSPPKSDQNDLHHVCLYPGTTGQTLYFNFEARIAIVNACV
jgi:hypothetical protein